MRYLGFAACISVATLFFACGGDDSGGNPGGGGPNAGGAGGAPDDGGGEPATGAKSGSGNNGGNTGQGGEPAANAGAGGEPPIGPASMGKARNGNGPVVDGVVAHSQNFTMVLSVGEEPGGNISMFSKAYRVNLGVVGSTQK
jgi:hypothetical protein